MAEVKKAKELVKMIDDTKFTWIKCERQWIEIGRALYKIDPTLMEFWKNETKKRGAHVERVMKVEELWPTFAAYNPTTIRTLGHYAKCGNPGKYTVWQHK